MGAVFCRKVAQNALLPYTNFRKGGTSVEHLLNRLREQHLLDPSLQLSRVGML